MAECAATEAALCQGVGAPALALPHGACRPRVAAVHTAEKEAILLAGDCSPWGAASPTGLQFSRPPPSPVRARRAALSASARWTPKTCSTRASESDECFFPCGQKDLDDIELAKEPQAVDRGLPDPTAVFDVVADAATGEARLMPAGGDSVDGSLAGLRVSDLPEEAVVTIRVFRFFEDRKDEARGWEKELRNVNSGSLMWLLVHMQPKMHSVSGAKYGSWFTVHHVRVLAKSFKSGYFMCEEGSCPLAKSFGATTGLKKLVTGQHLNTGYFWFVSPDRKGCGPSQKDVSDDDNLQQHGWQHVRREGPFDGDAFLAEWRKQSSPMKEIQLQRVLRAISK